jgi:hypothetical protein
VGEARESYLGVSHGGGRVSIDGTEVSLAVDKGIPEREVLGHSDDGVINSRVPVGMVFTDNVPDDPGGFLEFPVPEIPHLVHGKDDTPVNGFQAVPRVGKGTPHDYAHGVIHVRALHLIFNIDGNRNGVLDGPVLLYTISIDL